MLQDAAPLPPVPPNYHFDATPARGSPRQRQPPPEGSYTAACELSSHRNLLPPVSEKTKAGELAKYGY